MPASPSYTSRNNGQAKSFLSGPLGQQAPQGPGGGTVLLCSSSQHPTRGWESKEPVCICCAAMGKFRVSAKLQVWEILKRTWRVQGQENIHRLASLCPVGLPTLASRPLQTTHSPNPGESFIPQCDWLCSDLGSTWENLIFHCCFPPALHTREVWMKVVHVLPVISLKKLSKVLFSQITVVFFIYLFLESMLQTLFFPFILCWITGVICASWKKV